MNDSKKYKITKGCIFCSQLRENHKITNMYQKNKVDLESARTKSDKNSPNTPEKSQLKKWLGIGGTIASMILIATAIGLVVNHIINQSKCQNNGKYAKDENGTFTCNCTETGFVGKFCQNVIGM